MIWKGFSPVRKTILSAAVAFALASAGLIVMTSSSEAAVRDVPTDCKVSTPAYRSDGQRLSYDYTHFSGSTEAIEGDKLAWVPTALADLGDSRTEILESLEYAAHPTDGYLYKLERQGVLTDGVWKITKVTATRVAAGFGGTRLLVYAYPYLYRITGNSLYRYLVVGDYEPVDREKLPGTAWDTVKTLAYARRAGTDSAPADVSVLIGTKSNGELKEWRFSWYATPSSIPSTVLRSAGWGAFTSLSTGYCYDHANGRPLLAITAAGSASVYFDAAERDRDGTDIKGGSLGSLGWTAKAYGYGR